jgi:hypothetical protein
MSLRRAFDSEGTLAAPVTLSDTVQIARAMAPPNRADYNIERFLVRIRNMQFDKTP